MGPTIRFASRVATLVALVATVVVCAPGGRAMGAVGAIPMRAAEVAAPVSGQRDFVLPFAAQHVAVHWPGQPEARVAVALSSDGRAFGASTEVRLDELAIGHPSGESFGAVIAARGATKVRVSTDRPLGRLTVLAMADDAARPAAEPAGGDAAAGVGPPEVIARADWGADEEYRFTRHRGKRTEVWPAEFHRVQKLVVHHTATTTVSDPQDAAAQVRAIYYYHAVTLGWGDIGYNFVVDPFGRVYEGRYSGSPTGEDGDGRVVTAGHTYQHNTGTLGIAFLGDATEQPPSEPASAALVDFLAWESSQHGLDPLRSSRYYNVVNEVEREILNVAGHRDYVATACPGDAFYPLLGQLRSDVAAALGAGAGDEEPPPPVDAPTAAISRRQVTLTWPASAEPWEPDASQSGIAYYVVQRASGPTGEFGVIGATDERTRTFVDSRVRGTIRYQVLAVDGAGNVSAPSPVTTVEVR